MGTEKAQAVDVYGVAMAAGGNVAEAVGAPRFFGDFVCWENGPNGEPRVAWAEKFANVVVDQGKGYIINRVFGSQAVSTQGALLFLHSATTASNNVWSNISASQVVSYGASIPAITFASSYTAGSASASASYGFTASTQTVSGAGILFYTSASGGTNLATVDAKMYAYGLFAASQQVQNGNSLSVSLTLSYA
jgi:hypothetical protein